MPTAGPARPDGIFRVDGDVAVPDEIARGPWDPNAMHGGAPAALLARAVERAPTEHPMHVARLTVELLRPAPLHPGRITTRLVRPGKRVQLVEAVLTVDDVDVARAVALRVAPTPSDLPADAIATDAVLPDPDTCEPWSFVVGTTRAFDAPMFGDAFELRAVAGDFTQPGPATYWFRQRVELVAGEPTSPLCRVMAVADFGNGISQVLGQSHVFINPDLTAYVHRPADGEWIGLEARTRLAPGAGGFAEGVLHDRTGPLGRSVQALYVAPR